MLLSHSGHAYDLTLVSPPLWPASPGAGQRALDSGLQRAHGASWQVRLHSAPAGPLRGAADFDGDGRGDYMIRTAGDTVTVYSGLDGSVLAAVTNQLGANEFDTARDMDGDGVREVFFRGIIGSRLVSGDTNAEIWSITDALQRNVGDIDRDGYDDFAAGLAGLPSGYTLANSGVTGVSTGVFVSLPTGFAPSGIRIELAPIGDANGDGRADWAVGSSDGFSPPLSSVVSVSGAGGTLGRSTLTGIGAFEHVASADLDGDGQNELLVSGSNGTLEVRTSGTALLFSLPVGGVQELAGVGDVNGDGFEDVALDLGSQVVVRFGPDLTCAVPTGLVDLAAGEQGHDMDGDGFADVLGSVGGDVGIASCRVRLYDVLATIEGRGPAVAFGGDYTGDSIADFAIGSVASGVGGRADFYSGQTQAANGAAITGAFGAETGRSLASFADPVQGPGFLVGQPGASLGRGQVVLRAPLFGTTYSKAGVQPGDAFGFSVAAAGDVNNDGFADFVVGAQGGGYVQVVSGAYIASLSGPEVLHTETGAVQVNNLGFAVDGGADVNGDGFDDVLMSDPSASAGLNAIGIVYVVSGEWITSTLAGASPVTQRYLHQKVGVQPNGNFGWSCKFVSDVNGDGRPEFAVGAPDEDFGSAGAGAVRVYDGATGAVLLTRGFDAGARGGFAIASVGDLDADGCGDLAVGAPGQGSDRGRVEVLSPASGRTLLLVDGRNTGDLYGSGLAGGADVNGDGIADLLVSAALGGTSGGPYVQLFAGQSPWPMAKAELYGIGCPDPSGVQPRIDARGIPALGEAIDILLRGAPTSGFAIRRLGFLRANRPSGSFPGCFDLVDSVSNGFVLPDSSGRSSRTLQIPNDAIFLGVRLRSQWWTFTTTLATSEGLELEVGRRPGV